MRLFLLAGLAMLGFAANSVLNRMAVGQGLITAEAFAALRALSGALGLWLLLRGMGRNVAAPSAVKVLALASYLVGFSLAYQSLEAGTGALILFGGVQITMLIGARLLAEPLPPRRLIGMGVAMLGLTMLLLPANGAVPDPGAAALMGLAAMGWGVYSLAGRGSRDPLAETAASFLYAAPLVCLPIALLPGTLTSPPPTAPGAGLAALSGAVTSGLAYALWYAILPRLGAARAAAAQLSVPVLAMAGGLALLAERPSLGTVTAMGLTLAGVAIATLNRRR